MKVPPSRGSTTGLAKNYLRKYRDSSHVTRLNRELLRRSLALSHCPECAVLQDVPAFVLSLVEIWNYQTDTMAGSVWQFLAVRDIVQVEIEGGEVGGVRDSFIGTRINGKVYLFHESDRKFRSERAGLPEKCEVRSHSGH